MHSLETISKVNHEAVVPVNRRAGPSNENAAGEAFRSLRLARVFTQERVAKALGVAVNTVSRWESGEYEPSLSHIWQASKFFGVGVEVFFPCEESGGSKADRIDRLVFGGRSEEMDRTEKVYMDYLAVWLSALDDEHLTMVEMLVESVVARRMK